MRGAWKFALVLALVALLAAGLVACGSSDSESTTAGTTAAPTEATTSTATTEDHRSGKGAEEPGDDHGGSSKEPDDSPSGDDSAGKGGSASFRTPGGDNSIQNFGDEADSAELEAATAALTGFMEARAEGDWTKQCTYLAKLAVKPLEQLADSTPSLKGKGCAAILAGLLSKAPAASRANTMVGGVVSLRAEGDRGFALYRGPKGVAYFAPMVKEDGQWKVATLSPSQFP